MVIEKIIRAKFKERVHLVPKDRETGFDFGEITSDRADLELQGEWLLVRGNKDLARVPRENISFLKVIEIESPAAKPAVGSSRRSRRKSK